MIRHFNWFGSQVRSRSNLKCVVTKHDQTCLMTKPFVVWLHCLMLFDSVWSCFSGKIWNPSNIRSKSMKHRYCSRVWCVMFGSLGRLHQIHLARACVFRCRFWSYASKMAVRSVFDGLFDTRLATSSNTGKVCSPSILRLTGALQFSLQPDGQLGNQSFILIIAV